MIENLSAWFEARGIPPLLGGAILSVAVLLVFKTLFRSRSDRTDYAQVDSGTGASSERAARTRSATTTTTTHELPPDVSARVIALVQTGNKIEAIKIVRDASGLGLKEAKDVVDAMAGALEK